MAMIQSFLDHPEPKPPLLPKIDPLRNLLQMKVERSTPPRQDGAGADQPTRLERRGVWHLLWLGVPVRLPVKPRYTGGAFKVRSVSEPPRQR